MEQLVSRGDSDGQVAESQEVRRTIRYEMTDQPTTDESLAYLSFDTPIGRLGLSASPRGLLEVRFDAPSMSVVDGVDATPKDPAGDLLRAARGEIEAYLRGGLRDFSVPLEPRGSVFNRALWAALCEIPYGATRSYGELAHDLDKPGASRAVGLACGANPLPLVIPCHRVLAAGGHLGGFSGGLVRKQWLLHLEAFGRPPRDAISSATSHAQDVTAVQQKLDL